MSPGSYTWEGRRNGGGGFPASPAGGLRVRRGTGEQNMALELRGKGDPPKARLPPGTLFQHRSW